MTLLDALVFVLGTGALVFVIDGAAAPLVRGRARSRVAVTVAVVALVENAQLARHTWQALLVLAAAAGAAALPVRTARVSLLGLVALGGPLVLRPRVAVDLYRDVIAPDYSRILLVGTGLLVVVVVGSSLVEQLIGRIRGLPSSSAEAERPVGAPAGGKTIGMLERGLVYGAVLVGHPEALAVVVAVKSVARFRDFDGNRTFAEYFLIGTMSSLLFALAVAYAVQAALGAT